MPKMLTDGWLWMHGDRIGGLDLRKHSKRLVRLDWREIPSQVPGKGLNR